MATYDVFISHKSQDKEQLTRIENFLEAKGITYWSDSKMSGGSKWMNEIEEGIQQSEIMLYLLSQNAIDDPDNIEAEINLTTQLRKDFVVVKLDNSIMADYKGAFNLYLKKVQWIDANNNINSIYDALYIAIKRLLDKDSSKDKENDVKLEVELERMKKRQEEELEQNFDDKVMQRIMTMNITTVNRYISQGEYTHALNKLNELLLTDSNWEFLELKLKCLTRNYCDFSNDNIDQVLKEIKDNGCPKEEYQRILNEMDSSRQKIIKNKKDKETKIIQQKIASSNAIIERKKAEYQKIKKEMSTDTKIRYIKWYYFTYILNIL